MAPLILRNVHFSPQFNANGGDFAGINSSNLVDDYVKPSNTKQKNTLDSITFTVMTLSVAIAGILIVCFSRYYYIFHTAIFLVIYAHRIVKFTKDGHHYLLIHLCYIVNVLTLIYAWTASTNGYLFTGLFFLANGPVIWTIPCMRNSIVPHSPNKMFSVYLHTSPALTLFGIKWNSVAEQQFALCPNGSEHEGCGEVGWRELYFCAIVLWLLWMAFYLIVVEVWKNKVIRENEFMTFFKLLVINRKSIIVSKFCSLLPQYKKGLFYIFESFFMLVTIFPVYFYYHWMSLHILNIALCVLIASYNGANYYLSINGTKHIQEQRDKDCKDYK